MKLAEAVILRADCQKRIAQLKSRLLTNAKVQEGDAPAETPQELIAELRRVSTELLDLIKRINRTNSATAFAGRGTISDAALASANWPNKNSKNPCARRPMANQNLELLKVAAKLLEPVLDELVFVGGCATGLLVSD